MKNYLLKFKTADKSPARNTLEFSFYSGLGGLLAISIIAVLSERTSIPLIMAPFGASCVLAFGVPDSPLAQPRNILGGHLISSLIGVLCYSILGNSWYSLAIGVGLAIFIMQLTQTTHPPAGADPLVIILAGASWKFLINPVLSGSLILVVVALIFNNIHSKRKYPKYWK
ncbi:HPP family protein [Desertivirga arenae]|uniref:HPP family protein n=1 Tax=Desertivirga arenae TaxID=2810309 RepID=UPI001A968735|nr:HPP family protein [Pedobacter sp. SYSU D00823]